MNNTDSNNLNNNIHEILDRFIEREKKTCLNNLKSCKEILEFATEYNNDFERISRYVRNSLFDIDFLALRDYSYDSFSFNDTIDVVNSIGNKTNDYLAYLISAISDKEVLQEVIDKYISKIEDRKCTKIEGVFTNKSLYTFRVVNGVVQKPEDFKYNSAGYGHIAYKFARTILDESYEKAAIKNYSNNTSKEAEDYDDEVQKLMNEYIIIQDEKQVLSDRETELLRRITSAKANANLASRKK